MPPFTTPKGNTYSVKDVRFQLKFLYEYPYGKTIDQVSEEYQSSRKHCMQLWGTSEMLPVSAGKKGDPKAKDRRDRLKAVYGDFDAEDYVTDNIVAVKFDDLPGFKMRKESHPVSSSFGLGGTRGDDVTLSQNVARESGSNSYIKFHRLLANQIRQALNRVFEWSAKNGYDIRGFSSYARRDVASSGSTSNHTLGTAIDINASQNWIGDRVWDMPKDIVRIMMEEGFYWGGNYHPQMNKKLGRVVDNQDPMHFEYARPYFRASGLSRGRLVFPLSLQSAGVESPMKYYENTEKPDNGVGGYYGLGLQRNLHGGVHLFPKETGQPVPVVCAAPGYIAAVRLPRDGGEEAASDAMRVAHNWTGFVLVRHDVNLRKTKEDSFEAKKAKPLYSLYMHLAPLGTSTPESAGVESLAYSPDRDPYFSQVSWFGQMIRRRFGTFTRLLDSEDERAGTTYWSKVPVDKEPGEGESFPVYDRSVAGKAKKKGKHKDKDQESEVPKTDVIPKPAGSELEWFFKAAPADFVRVAQALQDGKLVTFNEPFFPLDAGETVGLLTRPVAPRSVPRRKKSPIESKLSPSGFLHWEIFAPAGDRSSVREVLKFAGEAIPELKEAFAADNVISETTEDNFLDIGELRQKVIPRLKGDDQTKLKTAVDEMERKETARQLTQRGVAADVIELFADGARFTPKGECDVTKEDGSPVDESFTYPLKVQIECDGLVPASQLASGQPYKMKVEYYKTRPRSKKDDAEADPDGMLMTHHTQLVTINAGLFGSRLGRDGDQVDRRVLTLTFRVPASADRLRIVPTADSEMSISEPETPSDDDGVELLKVMAGSRWRGTRITHLSEWSPNAVKKLFAKLQERKLLAPDADVNALSSLAWWQEGAVKTIRAKILQSVWSDKSTWRVPLLNSPSVETVKAVGDGDSLFGDQLPNDAHVDNVHPVTFSWLMNILEGRGLAEIAVPKRGVFEKEDPKPLAMGWITSQAARQPRFGDPIGVLIIDDDFGYDPSVKLTVKAKSAATELTVVNREQYGPNGIVFKDLVADFWGRWKLEVDGCTPKVVGRAELVIDMPKLLDTDEEDVKQLRHVPRRHGYRVLWCVKVAPGTDMPSVLKGIVGVELSTDGVTWFEPLLGGKKICMAAEASGTVANPAHEVNSKELVVKDDCVIGIAPGNKDRNPFVTKSLRYGTFSKAYTDIRVACGLVQALDDIGCQPTEIASLDSDGMSCVLRPASWSRTYQLAIAALTGARLVVKKVGDELPLSEAELKDQQHAPTVERLKDLKQVGLRLTVRAPLPSLELCPSIRPANVKTAGDDRFIVGMQARATQITGRLQLSHLQHKSPTRISCFLAQGLEDLHALTNRPINPSYLSFDGGVCILPGAAWFEAAAGIPFFKSVSLEGEGKQHNTLLAAPAMHAMTLSFDPSELLSEIRREQMSKGFLRDNRQQLRYRYFFCAPNGYSLHKPGGARPEDYAHAQQSDFGVETRKTPDVVQARCLVATGSLRAMAFGPVTLRLVEGSVRVTVALLGNLSLWTDAVVEVRLKGAKASKKQPASTRVTLTGQESTLQAALKAPHGTQAQIEIQLVDCADFDATLAPREEGKINLEKKFLSDDKAGGLAIKRIGDYFVVWCHSQGLEAPMASAVDFPFVKGADDLGQPAPAQKRVPKAFELELQVREDRPPTLLPMIAMPLPSVEYYVPVKNGGGYLTRDGYFAARFYAPALDARNAYLLTLKPRSAKGNIKPMNGRIPALVGPGPAF